MSESVSVEDQETQELSEDLGDQELLQQFQTVDEEGNTIVLTAEQLQSYQEQADVEHSQEEQENETEIMMEGQVDADADVETQEIVHEILESEGAETDLETHTIIDEHGNHQLVSGENLQDLITLHSVDADGNIVTSTHSTVGAEEHVSMEEHVSS